MTTPSERSAISQAVQVGIEAVPGTGVAATRRLGSLGVEMGVNVDIKTIRPVGQKYASSTALGKEWTEAELSGSPVYTELPYLLASLISAPTTQAITDGTVATGATRWTFDSTTFGADAPLTLTVEQGDRVRAHRAVYGLISELTMEWSREEIELDGTMLARRLQDGILLTPGATQLPQVPVRPSELSVFLDNTAAGLGTTKLGRAISGEWSIGGDRYLPVWVVDAAQDSFVGHVEGEPEVTSALSLQANAQGMESLVRMRAGGTAFIRLHAVGPVIYTAGAVTVRHELILDTAAQVTEVEQFSEEDGIYAIGFNYTAVHDPTWARAFRATVVTTTSAL